MKRIILFAFGALFSMPTASAQSPLELFQQALRLESVQGDLEGAIALYERVGASYGSDRALGARALFRMGQAYETLGQNDATRAYRRIVSEFADQAETVAMAEAALGRLVVPRKRRDVASLLGPAAPHIESGASLSRDGKFVVFTDWGTGRMGYLELGKTDVQWITTGFEDQTYAESGRLSPDSREIAYVWENYGAPSSAVRVYDRATGETREILADVLGVYDWTSDGAQILTGVSASDGTVRLGLINSRTGIHGEYMDFEHLSTTSACLLKDRIVLFEDNSDGIHRVRRADLVSKTVESFLANGASSRLIGCSSEKSGAVITSNEFGEFTPWAYRLDAGRPAGPGVSITDIPGGAVAAGGVISNDGNLLFLANGGSDSTELFRTVDGSITERVLSLPVAGDLFRLGWSPDGSKFAYQTTQGSVHIADTLGASRAVNLTSNYRVMNWLPDGSGFIASWMDGDRWLSNRIDLETGHPIDSDTLSGFVPEPGRAGRAVVEAYWKDAETICVGEYAGGPDSREDLVCYRDPRAKRITTGSLNTGRGDGLWPQVMAGSNSVVVLAFSGERGADANWYYTLIDLETGETRVILRTPRLWRRLQQLPESGEIVTDRPGEGPIRITGDGQMGDSVFKQFGDLRRITSYSFHPSEKLVLISSRPRVSESAESASGVGMLLDLWDRLK